MVQRKELEDILPDDIDAQKSNNRFKDPEYLDKVLSQAKESTEFGGILLDSVYAEAAILDWYEAGQKKLLIKLEEEQKQLRSEMHSYLE